MRKILNLWLPPISWAVVIFLFSANPTFKTTEIYWQDFVLKKTAHIVEYFILSTLLYRAFRQDRSTKEAAILAIVVSIFYASSDEIHQMFTPGREPRLRDVVFDTIGASLAIIVLWKLLPKAPKKLKFWAERLLLI